MSLKVLIVDDTIVYRKIVSDALAGVPDVEVVSTASNGKIALSRIAALKPDLLVLDIEMPEMNGLEVLGAIKENSLDVGVIVLSALTVKGGEMTMKALELGAFDFITKPESASAEESRNQVKSTLVPLVKAYGHTREVKSILKGVTGTRPVPQPLHAAKASAGDDGQSLLRSPVAAAGRRVSEVVGIGISTGGPSALMKMLPSLAPDLNVPIFIVQHMPPAFTRSLAESLDSRCAWKVKEGEDGETVQPGTGYIAPGGKQMKVTLGADALTKIIRVTDDPPENHCKPSVDYLFRSLAHHYVGRATGVIMTGMGNDGTAGLKLMKRSGAVVIAQDEPSCVVFGMPGEAIRAGVVDVVAPLDELAGAITKTVRQR
jgi:two-component system, chemotaxis family, protein-glutamate methylesterase/glutaminase